MKFVLQANQKKVNEITFFIDNKFAIKRRASATHIMNLLLNDITHLLKSLIIRA